jgi:hypothetical protein
MYKSAVVKLVLLNSVLAFSACARTCEPEEVKKDGQQLAEDKAKPRRSSCRGSSRSGGTHFFYWHGGGGGTGTGGRTGQSGSGNVGRGGFGATGSGAAS